jgi:ABC-type phosphate transport system ATPase subunit
MINRLVTPTSGKVFIAGRDTDVIDPVELRRTIGYVIQQIGLFPNMTVAQNIGVVPRLLKWDAARMRRRAEELLAMLALEPAEFMDRLSKRAFRRTGATGRCGARARRRSARAVDGRALRRRRPGQSRSDPGRVPAHAEIVAQDGAVREPRHR